VRCAWIGVSDDECSKLVCFVSTYMVNNGALVLSEWEEISVYNVLELRIICVYCTAKS
jgi:hypothetical protein